MRQYGVCAFAEAPNRDGSEARLFWNAELDPLTVRATARRCTAGDPDAFDLGALALPTTIVKDMAGEEAIIGRGAAAVRLSIVAGTVLNGPVRLSYLLEGRRHLARRLLALRRLEAVMRLRRVPRPLAVPTINADRAMLLVNTLDALAVEPNMRAVATALFGAGVVASDWEHESDYLRMKTRRLIGTARKLAGGGYLALLARGH